MSCDPKRRVAFSALALIFIVDFTVTDPCFGQSTFWVADGVGNWFVPANWSAGVPGSSSNAEINNGGTARLFDFAQAGIFGIGNSTGNSGTLEILGGNATFNEIAVGKSGTGALRIENGGILSTDKAYLAAFQEGTGSATVTGANSNFDTKQLSVGLFGAGTLAIANGGRLSSDIEAYIGDVTGSTGMVTVDGAASKWTNGGSLTVGHQGVGSLDVSSGGVVQSVNGYVGLQAGSSGSVTVAGAQSDWDISGVLHIGSVGTGMVTVSDGGELRANSEILVNRFAAGNGTLLVTGAGSETYTQGELRVADEGVGLLRIENGGFVSTGTSAYLGRNAATADGTAVVSGGGSSWFVFQSLFVGGAGKGTLTVADFGAVSAATGVGVGPQGKIAGDGVISGTISNDGVVAPGAPIGALQVFGNYYENAPAKLQIEIESASSFDALDVTGDIVLNGTLEVSLTGGYVPSGNRSFDILDWTGGLSGTFASIQLPTLGGTLTWDTSQLYTTGVLSVVGPTPMLEADFDEDGDVDGADLVKWKAGFGASGLATHMQGDADGDHDVDGRDFLVWQRQLGGGAATTAATAAPEPASAWLAWLSVGTVFTVCRRVRSRPWGGAS